MRCRRMNGAPNNAVASHISTLAVSMSLYLCLWRWYGFRLWTRHFLSEAQPHFFPSSFLSKCPWTFLHAFSLAHSFVCSLVHWHFLQPLSLHLRCFSHCSVICWFYIYTLYSCSMQCEMQFSATKLKPNQLFSNKLEFASKFNYGLLYEMWFV